MKSGAAKASNLRIGRLCPTANLRKKEDQELPDGADLFKKNLICRLFLVAKNGRNCALQFIDLRKQNSVSGVFVAVDRGQNSVSKPVRNRHINALIFIF
jgi:hypothetical protein